jgi:hypothetical protein
MTAAIAALTEQIVWVRERVAVHESAARVAADIPLIRDQHLADARMLSAILATLQRERQRLRDHAADWS